MLRKLSMTNVWEGHVQTVPIIKTLRLSIA